MKIKKINKIIYFKIEEPKIMMKQLTDLLIFHMKFKKIVRFMNKIVLIKLFMDI